MARGSRERLEKMTKARQAIVMRRDQAPQRDRATQQLGSERGVSQHLNPESTDWQRGSHVTPVAPPAEPTDPFSSAGPLTRPPSWLPLDGGEPIIRDSDIPGPSPSLDTLEFYAEPESPRPRDTLPSPPPNPDEPDSIIPPTIVDHRHD